MPKFGPDFLPAESRVFNLEYLVLSLALIGILALQNADIKIALVFLIMPDLVFIPILLFRRKGDWPKWGGLLYNATHSFIVWIPFVAAAWFFYQPIFWPSFAWGLHICIDRALGLTLRQ